MCQHVIVFFNDKSKPQTIRRMQMSVMYAKTYLISSRYLIQSAEISKATESLFNNDCDYQSKHNKLSSKTSLRNYRSPKYYKSDPEYKLTKLFSSVIIIWQNKFVNFQLEGFDSFHHRPRQVSYFWRILYKSQQIKTANQRAFEFQVVLEFA